MRANFLLSEVITGLRRNLTMTVAMIITTAISLGFFGAAMLVTHEVDSMKKIYFDKLQVSVFLRDDIKPDQRDTLQSQLADSPEVSRVQYLSKEQSYERYKQLFANQKALVDIATAATTPAAFLVQLKQPERYAVIQQQFGGSPGVDVVQSQSQILDPILNLFKQVRLAAIVIAVIQVFAALMLISNTIQVAAFHRRNETSIMRLVGASRWYTQLPFILEAVVAGLVGGLLAVLGLVVGKEFFLDRILGNQIRSGILPAVSYGTILWPTTPLVLGIGVALASIAAYVTLRLYVRL
ncbi:MAG: ABC transporter permease [Actinobacteria bacterium]|nr:ABC transporter permease [Actinomycetota bacterium]MBI3687952.1 ABC transporter permease [Actinomycetota bacterium]